MAGRLRRGERTAMHGGPCASALRLASGRGRERLRIVCAVADSEESRAAVEFAATLAERWDADLVPVCVTPADPSQRGAPFVLDLEGYRMAARERARGLLEREVGSTRAERGRVRMGEPAAELAKVAAEESASLLIVGEPRRMPWLRRWRFARRLIGRAPCPVPFFRRDAGPLIG